MAAQQNRTIGLLAAVVLLGLASEAHALAALAGGAKTSCKPTSTNPALYQMQVNADPLNVDSYQLTMSFNNELLMFNPDTDVVGVNGYSAVVTQLRVVGPTGFVTVTGSNPARPPGELDVFGVIFTMRSQSTPLTTPLEFSVFGDATTTPGPDFVRSFDTDTGNLYTYTPDQILPSYSGPVAIVPEPSAYAVAGALGLLAMGRRRK